MWRKMISIKNVYVVSGLYLQQKIKITVVMNVVLLGKEIKIQ